MKKLKRNIDFNACFRVEVVNEYKSDKNINGKKSSSANSEQISKFPKNFMEKDEYHEKCFQNAIIHKSSILVPDIVELNKEDYDRLYPENFKVPKIRVMVQPHDEPVDYDIDDEDELWLSENGNSLKLTTDDFEKYMEFLENAALSSKVVPPLSEFTSHFNDSIIGMEASYDYWINKKISIKGHSLLFNLKKEVVKPGVKQKYDPYVAFRPCRERMHLRKNRARDYENYVKMLEIRERMHECLKFYQSYAVCETTKHELLKIRFSIFKDQYQTKGFNAGYLEKEALCNTEYLFKELKENQNGQKNEELVKVATREVVRTETKENCESELFSFKRLHDCNYHPVRNDPNADLDVENENEFYYSTDMGIKRRRLGRGGRIIYDRIDIPSSCNIEPDFQAVDFRRNIYIQRFDDDSNSNLSPNNSPFNLHSTIGSNVNLSDMEMVFNFEK